MTNNGALATATMSSEQLPSLSSEFQLKPEDVNHFRTEGFVILRNVFTREEVEAYRAEIRRSSAEFNEEKQKLENRDAFGKAFLQTTNLRLQSPGVMQLVASRRIGKLVADLLGIDGVRILHDQSLFKEPSEGTNPTPWHQDQFYWPLEEATTAGFWMPLVDIEPDMGGMMWAARTHGQGFLGQHAISDDSQAYFDNYISEHGLQVTAGVPMKQGDISFHYGWTLHGAKPNTSHTLREAMVGAYFADGMRIVMEPTNALREKNLVKCLGGKAPGELADSPQNTLVYQRANS